MYNTIFAASRRKAAFVLGLFCMVFLFQLKAYALSTRITFSDPAATAGEEFDVTMKISSVDGPVIAGANVMLSYDANVLEFISGTSAEGGAGSIRLGPAGESATEWVYTLRFRALSPGETHIQVASWEIYDADSVMAGVEHQGSGKVTIAGNPAASSEASLSSLGISPGELTPGFSPEQTEYNVLVGAEVEKLIVSAVPSHPNARVEVSGDGELILGDNTVSIEVWAEDGASSKKYTLHVSKQEGVTTPVGSTAQAGSDRIRVGGREYDVAVSFDQSLLPEGFELSTFQFRGQEVAAGRGIDKDILIMYLIGDDASGDFFIYDSARDMWSVFAQISVNSKTITLVPLPEAEPVPEGFAESIIELNGKQTRGWIWASDLEQRYCVVYAMNREGERGFYRYDFKEKTIQRYFSDPAIDNGADLALAELTQKYDTLREERDTQFRILLGVCALAGLLFILLLVSLLVRGKRKTQEKRQDRRVEEIKKAISDTADVLIHTGDLELGKKALKADSRKAAVSKKPDEKTGEKPDGKPLVEPHEKPDGERDEKPLKKEESSEEDDFENVDI